MPGAAGGDFGWGRRREQIGWCHDGFKVETVERMFPVREKISRLRIVRARMGVLEDVLQPTGKGCSPADVYEKCWAWFE